MIKFKILEIEYVFSKKFMSDNVYRMHGYGHGLKSGRKGWT